MVDKLKAADKLTELMVRNCSHGVVCLYVNIVPICFFTVGKQSSW